MFRLPLRTWIGNAAAVLCGSHGDVTRQARDAGCSRQAAYDHAAKLEALLAEDRAPGPGRAELLQQRQQLQEENARLRGLLAGCIALDEPRRKRLAARAHAMGLSCGQIAELFRDLLDGQPAELAQLPPPSRATVGRWVRAACLLAAGVLHALDEHTRGLATTLCLDEIFFHGKPVLVAVEPASMAVLLCAKAADRTGPTWQRAVGPFGRLEHVVADAGTGLQAGLRGVQQGRPEDRPLTVGLDVFHLEQEARRVLGRLWRKVEAGWAKAERADAVAANARPRQRAGRLARARAAWDRVKGDWAWHERCEAAWSRLKAALGLFRPDGRLSDRAWAEAEVRAACQRLPGPWWRKVRAMAHDPRLLAFLDRLERQLGEAEPCPAAREALVELWRLEQQRGQAAAVLGLVQRVICSKGAGDWERGYQRVGAVLAAVVRASSAVECVNSVLRMQQGRHRNVSQEMLDLKRLYWNCREVRTGKRKGRCPYEHLGARLPTYDFWELLNSDPSELAQKLSNQKVAA